jgi:hypothetical protein
MRRESTVRIPTRTLVTACALSAALLVAGCGGDRAKDTKSSGEVFLQPVAAQGPDPFTDSTATDEAGHPPVTRTPQSAPSTGSASETLRSVRSISGGTPGLYGGTERAASCDVERQIRFLTADRAKARAFAQAEGISQVAIPGYLRGLTSVVLRADTRVTNHGFRDGQAADFQSVLQAGTAVLVDNRGVPRVRCACGNPLRPATALRDTPATSGRSWSGYRPAEVVVVTPAPQVITNITIINIVDHTWIERPLGHHGHDHDHVVPPPAVVTPRPTPTPSPTSTSPSPGVTSASPRDESSSPGKSPTDCVTPTVTVTPGATGGAATGMPSPGVTGCPTATVTATPTTSAPPSTLTPGTVGPTTVQPQPSPNSPTSPDSSGEVGPSTVPDSPDLPDGGGLIPDGTATTGSILDSPTDVFDG